MLGGAVYFTSNSALGLVRSKAIRFRGWAAAHDHFVSSSFVSSSKEVSHANEAQERRSNQPRCFVDVDSAVLFYNAGLCSSPLRFHFIRFPRRFRNSWTRHYCCWGDRGGICPDGKFLCPWFCP